MLIAVPAQIVVPDAVIAAALLIAAPGVAIAPVVVEIVVADWMRVAVVDRLLNLIAIVRTICLSAEGDNNGSQ